MFKKSVGRLLISFTVICFGLSRLPVNAFADNVTMYQDTISLNGATYSSPYGFVDNGTTYMPLYYVIQLLKSVGISNAWNGTTGLWSLSSSTISSVSPLNQVKNAQEIQLNGQFFVGIQVLDAKDPSSGVTTAYIPIYDVMQVLKLLSINNTWDGVSHTWSIGTQNTADGTATGSTGSGSYTNTTGAQDPQDLINTANDEAETVIGDESTLNTDFDSLVTDVNTIKTDYQGTSTDFNSMIGDINLLNNDAGNGYDIGSDAQSVYSDVQGVVNDSQGSQSDIEQIEKDLQIITSDSKQLVTDNANLNATNTVLSTSDQVTLTPSTQSWYQTYLNNVNQEINYANGVLSQQQKLVNMSLQDARNVEYFASQYRPSEFSDDSNPLAAAVDLVGSVVNGVWSIVGTLAGAGNPQYPG